MLLNKKILVCTGDVSFLMLFVLLSTLRAESPSSFPFPTYLGPRRKIEGDSAPRVTTKKTIEFNTVTHLPLDILPKIAFWCQSSCFLVTVWLQWAKTGIYKSNTSGTSVPHQCKILAILKFQHAQKQNFNIAFGFKSDTADLTYKWVSI